MLRTVLGALFSALLAAALIYEVQTSSLQARLFSRLAADLDYGVESGPGGPIPYPRAGPYNQRLGYTRQDGFIEELQSRGFEISRQARFSPALAHYVAQGGNPPYREKLQAGLAIVDASGIPLYASRQPGRVYQRFEDIPPLLVDALLFIENRQLLDAEHPLRNPAVEWQRLGRVIAQRAAGMLGEGGNGAGASTLATQLEKYRYSPGGLTQSANEKFRQMLSASVRAYREGPDTTDARRRLVRDYLNSTPLSGRAGFGEIHGIGEGLWAWYGIDFDEANLALRRDPETSPPEQARLFKTALSLLLSQRRPSHLLLGGREELVRLTDSHLRLLADARVIDAELAEAALAQPLVFRQDAPAAAPAFARQKAVNSTRTELLSMLKLGRLYDLDRLDLTVGSTVVSQVQKDVETVLGRLVEPDYVRSLGMIGPKLLREDQLDAVRFSVLLYESTPGGNLLRVKTDNLDMPFDLNDGSKLDLGSTAKLRTLITYLEVVETLYLRHHGQPEGEAPAPVASGDPLREWGMDWLRRHSGASLPQMLDAAMAREYSARPEVFFTGGGQHRFSNYERSDDSRVMTVGEAFTRSVNLVFIRMMRDISRFHLNEIPGVGDLLQDRDNPLRREYLARFADKEGRVYLDRFLALYRGKDAGQLLDTLARRTRPAPYRLAAAFRSVLPHADAGEMAAFMALNPGAEVPSADELRKLHEQYGRDRFDSNDRAYLAGLHPLELWLVQHLLERPQATYEELLRDSADPRQIAYAWLFNTRNPQRQQVRISTLAEEDAFAAIHRQWQRLGYPFPSLVPSYATALGASADRPIALAELMGIILNDGRRLPMSQIESLHFGADTPYDTLLTAAPSAGEQVLSPEISRAVRQALVNVVENGTGKRLSGAFAGPDGQVLAVGGKTGTGDHRSRQVGRGAVLLHEAVVNRNVIFTFFIGDRFFGTILASVGGPQAADFDFTSGLAAQLLKALEPALRPLLLAQPATQAAVVAHRPMPSSIPLAPGYEVPAFGNDRN